MSAYMEPDLLLPSVQVDRPSLDAARVLGDGIRHAENLARAQADDVAAARKAVDAIHAIAAIDFTPKVAAQLAAVLAGRCGRASWSHFINAGEAIAHLDDAHDTLGAV